MNLPKHIVVVPDGNRRWAKKRGLLPFFGHREGAKSAEKILKAALDLKIPCLTLWGCSVNNIIKRPKKEIDFLFKVFGGQFRKLINDKKVSGEIEKNGVKVNFIGRWKEFFPNGLVKLIEEIIEKTKNNKNHQLTFLLAYSGTDEMTTAINKIAELKVKSLKLKVDEELIKNNLWTKDLPPVDLVIRTGGEPHWSSGLMMWDVSDAQLHFTKTLWPDFSEKEFKKIINDYSETERRLGK